MTLRVLLPCGLSGLLRSSLPFFTPAALILTIVRGAEAAGSDPAGVDTLDLKPPYRLGSCDIAKDGGTISGLLFHGDGDSLLFCRDGRMRDETGPDSAAPKPGLVYIGARYPTKPGAVPLVRGGAAEKLLFAALQASIDALASRAEQESLAALPGSTLASDWELREVREEVF